MEMDDVQLLLNCSHYTYSVIKLIFEELNEKLIWDENEKIADIGSGPGPVSANILSDFTPKNAVMVGGDISKIVIDYANQHYSNDKLSFEVMDITDEKTLTKWEKQFTSVLSFYVIQRIIDVRVAYENMYKLLKPGGKLMFLFPTDHPLERVFPLLAKIPKYKEYAEKLSKMKINVTPRESHSSYARDVLKDIGFDLLVCEEKKLDLVFDSKDSFSKLLRNSFPLPRILPKDLMDAAVEDSLKLIDEKKLIKKVDEHYKDSYSVLVVLAKKL